MQSLSASPTSYLLYISSLSICVPRTGHTFTYAAPLLESSFFPKSHYSWGRTLIGLSRVSFPLWNLSCVTDAERKLGCDSVRACVTMICLSICLVFLWRARTESHLFIYCHHTQCCAQCVPHREYSMSGWLNEWVGNQSRLESPHFSGYMVF